MNAIKLFIPYYLSLKGGSCRRAQQTTLDPPLRSTIAGLIMMRTVHERYLCKESCVQTKVDLFVDLHTPSVHYSNWRAEVMRTSNRTSSRNV